MSAELALLSSALTAGVGLATLIILVPVRVVAVTFAESAVTPRIT